MKRIIKLKFKTYESRIYVSTYIKTRTQLR